MSTPPPAPGPWRRPVAVLLLGEACAAWSGVPSHGALAALIFALSAACVLAGAVRLLLPAPVPDHALLLAGGAARAGHAVSALLRRGGWEQGAVVGFVVLEAVNGEGAWHAGLLGAGATCYLLLVLQAESAVAGGRWGGQSRLLAASVALGAAATGAAMLPAQGPGPLSGWLEVLGALAAMVAGALALPL